MKPEIINPEMLKYQRFGIFVMAAPVGGEVKIQSVLNKSQYYGIKIRKERRKGGGLLKEMKYLTIVHERKKIMLNIDNILYVIKAGKTAEIHLSGGTVYRVRMTLGDLETKLGDEFVKIHRGCVVSAMAVHDVTDQVNLSNGESLEYAKRKKKAIIQQLVSNKKNIISRLSGSGIPESEVEYRKYYESIDGGFCHFMLV